MADFNSPGYYYIDDDELLYKCLKSDIGFNLLFEFVRKVFTENVYRNSRNTRIFIGNEDELDVIVEIYDAGYITIEHSNDISESINDYIKNLPSIIRDGKINDLLS